MANDNLSFMDKLNFDGIGDEQSSVYNSFESMGGEKTGNGTPLYWVDEDWGQSWDTGSLNSIMSPPLQTCLLEIARLGEIENGVQKILQAKQEKQPPCLLDSLKLLPIYGKGLKRLSNGSKIGPSSARPCEEVIEQELSVKEILRIAGARFIQSSGQTVEAEFAPNNPFDLRFTSLSEEQVGDVELVELLLASAEKVGNGQYDSASRLLNMCDCSSSSSGNAIQRLVYYLSAALRERLDREEGKVISNGLEKKRSTKIYEAMRAPTRCNLVFHQVIPFCQVSHFAGVQAIVENVAEAKKIHIVDLQIRSGQQWAILMQALVCRDEPIELLKITAIGITSKQLIEDTGNRLVSFAQIMKLPFSFKIVMVSDLTNLKEDMFELDAEETVAVFSEYILPSLIARPNDLDSLMKVIRNMNPCIMVMTGVEANHNSPVFANLFIEILFFLGSYFDCLDACMKRDDPNRAAVEAIFFGEGLKSILATDGEDRNLRNVKIEVWRSYFARFGMVETELSMVSLYNAKLVAKKFPCGSSCTLVMDGKSLLIGWKGTPIHSLSAWMFTT